MQLLEGVAVQQHREGTLRLREGQQRQQQLQQWERTATLQHSRQAVQRTSSVCVSGGTQRSASSSCEDAVRLRACWRCRCAARGCAGVEEQQAAERVNARSCCSAMQLTELLLLGCFEKFWMRVRCCLQRVCATAREESCRKIRGR